MNLQVQQWNTPKKKGQWVSNKKNYKPIKGDDQDWDFNRANWFDCPEQFWWGADYYRKTLPPAGSFIVWDKRAGGLEDVAWKTSEFEMCWSKTRHHRRIARFRWMGVHGMEKQDTKKRVHPTQKPVELISWFLDNWGKKKVLIVDLFLGSGSTVIACEKAKKACYGMEIEPLYCDVIIQRWEEFTGKKAELIK